MGWPGVGLARSWGAGQGVTGTPGWPGPRGDRDWGDRDSGVQVMGWLGPRGDVYGVAGSGVGKILGCRTGGDRDPGVAGTPG
ncbi:PREDICTED: collagen alpha-1(VIII) chain-like [Charadrius vociferus]|uniref:collagen alpha-1(VIII) chain-like n=1 Tax=Charadrius vociferus TaxID=50402 RepID=UPI0005214372|nr:PREDICTED: collagen alpha-1(VIII) chain-like [Charadrius vociferus]